MNGRRKRTTLQSQLLAPLYQLRRTGQINLPATQVRVLRRGDLQYVTNQYAGLLRGIVQNAFVIMKLRMLLLQLAQDITQIESSTGQSAMIEMYRRAVLMSQR